MKQRKRFWVLAVALSLLAVGCSDDQVVNPTESSVPTPLFVMGAVVQSVTGAGNFTIDGNFRTFAFTARRHADGTVSGAWERVNHLNESQTKSNGRVTCFTIFGGNQARLGGFATSGLFSTPPNNEVAWRVADNSEGANSPADQISLQFVNVAPGTAGPYCAGAFGNIPALNTVVAGNIQVRP